MLELIYAPSFVKQWKKLPLALQQEVFEKLEMFKDGDNHKSLKVHKLKGDFKDHYSFSVNYSYRIIFTHGKGKIIYVLAVGDHDIYN